MILNSAPQDQATLSNVGQIGEFRIRNSAKAFSILSSGLYANKVRAIIRELSCNAVDSHKEAGKSSTPFDVHLPNALEAWFSIRDYGTGLAHDQVSSIYTTYFESTKTESNEYIGALGLGSKSPFSYTDNFTVTAIKNGRKGVYTAFINELGVPSIAQMMEEETDDPSGVEVKFSVNERYDFDKFRQEARQVYTHFKLRPVVSGSRDFTFIDPKFLEKDIVPGVHTISDSRQSYAVMGNIAYPIDIPQSDKVLPDAMKSMLMCGLVIEFGIGELDFQASREGLSYVPMTIDSIKRKLDELTGQLAMHIAVEANKVVNLWERAVYLEKRKSEPLWTQAVVQYVTDTAFPLMDLTTNSHYRYDNKKKFILRETELVAKFNIVLKGFSRARGYTAAQTMKCNSQYDSTSQTHILQWGISVSLDTFFVFNDTKIGASERAKFHWKNRKLDGPTELIYVVEAADKTKPVLKDAFLKEIYNPPESKILMASTLLVRERAAGMGKNVTIMQLEKRNRGYNATVVWGDAGKADSFDAGTTHYYVPLSGYASLGKVFDVKALHEHLNDSKVFTGTIYGVRKTDMDFIKTQPNWINLDVMIAERLTKLGQSDVMGLVKQAVDFKDFFEYNVLSLIKKDSPYKLMYDTFKDVKVVDVVQRSSLVYLYNTYQVKTQANIDPSALIIKYKEEVSQLKQRYPLMKSLTKYTVIDSDLAEYINLIDESKGI